MNNQRKYQQQQKLDKKLLAKGTILSSGKFYNGNRQRQPYHAFINYWYDTSAVVADYIGYYLPDDTTVTTTTSETDVTVAITNTSIDLPNFFAMVTPMHFGTNTTVPTYSAVVSAITNGYQLVFTPSALPSLSSGNGTSFNISLTEATDEQGLGNIDETYYAKPNSNANGTTFVIPEAV